MLVKPHKDFNIEYWPGFAVILVVNPAVISIFMWYLFQLQAIVQQKQDSHLILRVFGACVGVKSHSPRMYSYFSTGTIVMSKK